MKLLRYGPRGSERPAVLLADGGVVDVSTHVDDYDQRFFAGDGIGTLRHLVDGGLDGPLVDLGAHRVGAPIARPYQILCIGLNYADHAAETGAAIPTEPVLFNKGPSTLVGPDDVVLKPIGSTKLDWEVELSVVIGRTVRYLPDPSTALDHVAGYAIANDVSERSFQKERGGQFVKGKSCETFNPLGPWLVTPDEIPDVNNLALRLDVNGERMQDASTSLMIFDVAHLIWYLSQFLVLEPGDLINTGTPAGVGAGRTPPRYLDDGDVVELSIEGLGQQRQVVRQATR